MRFNALSGANTGFEQAARGRKSGDGTWFGVEIVTHRMLAWLAIVVMAGVSNAVKGVAGVVMVVARVWMKDGSPDLALTMKELDRRLQQAEEWAVSLRLFEPSHRRATQKAGRWHHGRALYG